MRAFAFRLALALGKTLAELGRMPAAEFAEWLAYYGHSPFGEERADLRSGIVASTVANAMAGRRGKTWTARDFMPDFGRSPTKPQTPAQQTAILNQFVAIAKAAGKLKVVTK